MTYIGRVKFTDSHKYLFKYVIHGGGLARVRYYTLSEIRSEGITSAKCLCVRQQELVQPQQGQLCAIASSKKKYKQR